MLSLTAPLWLLGLLSLPFIRWLHRFSVADRTIAVAALFLWRSTVTAETGGRRRGTPDPRWRLRALIVAALVVALAGPRLEAARGPAIDVWIDDSLSMHTVEHGRTRLAEAFDKLDNALEHTSASGVIMHSLVNPSVQRPWHREVADHGHGQWPMPDTDARPLPPPAALMDHTHTQWLITDGADAGLNAWAATAPLTRILQVGEGADNTAVTVLAARPRLDGADTARVLIGISNLGPHPQTRTVSLYAGGVLRQRQSVRLPAHSRRDVHLEVPIGAPAPLRATLSPADDLAEDDSLSLTAAGLSPVTVSVDNECPAALVTALRAHPRLHLTEAPGQPHGLRVVCTAADTATDGPTLRIHEPHAPEAVSTAPSWTDFEHINWPPLQRDWLFADRVPAPADTAVTLLGTDKRPLITVSPTTPRVVDVYLDVARPALVRQPAYLALVDGLISAAVGRSLLGETFSAVRPAGESRIAPAPVPHPGGVSPAAAPTSAAAVDLSPLAALLAALLLAVDLILVRRAPRGAPAYGGT